MTSSQSTPGIKIVDQGLRARPMRYRAELGKLSGREAETKAQAKANLLEDALAIASFDKVVVCYGDGGRAEVVCTGLGSYGVVMFAAGDANRGGGMYGGGDLRKYVLEAGRRGAFRGGIAHVSCAGYGYEPAMRAACEAEMTAQATAVEVSA